MLILSRKEGESVVVGEDIFVRVVSIEKGNVKLGFDAPLHKLILRSELKEAVVKQNKQALILPSGRQLEDISKHLK